jgi:6,7-dimethyl-8-ribityllumazine synthase
MKKTGYAAPGRPAKREFAHVRIAIATTRWNAEVVEALLKGARACLKDWGVAGDRIHEFRVPGAFELPLGLEHLARTRRYDGIVALGAVIRGDTPHFEYVAGECARGVHEVSRRHVLPLGFGVLTVDTPAQAAARAKPGKSNKGYEAAAAMLEMVRFKRESA